MGMDLRVPWSRTFFAFLGGFPKTCVCMYVSFFSLDDPCLGPVHTYIHKGNG